MTVGVAEGALFPDCAADLFPGNYSAAWMLTGTMGVSALTCFRP